MLFSESVTLTNNSTTATILLANCTVYHQPQSPQTIVMTKQHFSDFLLTTGSAANSISSTGQKADNKD